jgi:hypothetical protein
MEEKCGTAGEATGDNVIWRMRFVCWMSNATDTNKHTQTEYITITAFPLQTLLCRRASIFRYTYTDFLVSLTFRINSNFL